MPGEATRLQPRPLESPEEYGSPGELAGCQEGRERSVARLRLLADNAGLIGRVTACGIVAATALAFLIPQRYESTTRLMPPESQSSPGMALLATLAAGSGIGMGGGLASLGGELLGGKNTGVLFVGILRSRTVEDDVIKKFDLQTVYRESRWEDARKKLEARTDVVEGRKDGIITIRVADRSRERAAGMAAEYTAELDRVVNRLSTSAARREREFLEERLKGVQADLEDAEKQFSEFASKNTAIDIKEHGRAMLAAAANLQGQLIAAESTLEGMKQIYTDENIRVRSLEARIAELKSQLEKIGGKGENGLAAGSAAGESMYPSIRKLPLLGVEYADLYRRTRVQEAVFETLTQEYELAKVQEAKETPKVKVLDPADVPENRSFPPRLLIVFSGGCLALGAAIAFVVGRNGWQQTDPRDPLKALTLELWRSASAKLTLGRRNGSGGGRFGSRKWGWLDRDDKRLPGE